MDSLDHLAGLSVRGAELVSLAISVEVVDTCHGVLGDDIDLREYTLPDGRVVREFLQDSSRWREGPYLFLSLQEGDAEIEQVRWSDLAMDLVAYGNTEGRVAPSSSVSLPATAPSSAAD